MYEAQAKPSPAAIGTRLKLVEYVQPGDTRPAVCAALWQHGREVRLLAPALRDPSAGGAWLGSVLQWLDAACFAASHPAELGQVCDANPEWRLRCAPFDGSDRALEAVSDLLQACRRAADCR